MRRWQLGRGFSRISGEISTAWGIYIRRVENSMLRVYRKIDFRFIGEFIEFIEFV